MSWIRTIGPAQAEGELREIYERIAGLDGQVDNVLQIHSLRPHTLVAHMAPTRMCCIIGAISFRNGSSKRLGFM